jgi:hypothetical protein
MMIQAMTSDSAKALRVWLLGLGTVFSGLSAGCGDSDSPVAMKTYPVKGKVLLADGKPLASGVVVFSLPEKGMEFESPLESDGSFVLKSSYGDGAPEGSYKIRIQPDVSKPNAAKGSSARRSVANLGYPAKYGDETTSGLTAVVKASDNDLQPFTLAK